MITLKKVLKHELIGLDVQVIKSLNEFEIGIKGTIVNETQKTLVVKTDDGEKTIQKDSRQFIINVDGKKFDVDGVALVGRPEDRIKNKVKKWH
jgi:ribonuclease P protein subunit POP4